MSKVRVLVEDTTVDPEERMKLKEVIREVVEAVEVTSSSRGFIPTATGEDGKLNLDLEPSHHAAHQQTHTYCDLFYKDFVIICYFLKLYYLFC